MWGWLREARGNAAVVEAGWAGVQSLPRVLTLGDDDTLRMRPVPELERCATHIGTGRTLMSMPQHSPKVLPEVHGDAYELRIVYDLHASTAQTFGLQVRRSPEAEEYTTIAFDSASGTLTVDRAAFKPGGHLLSVVRWVEPLT